MCGHVCMYVWYAYMIYMHAFLEESYPLGVTVGCGMLSGCKELNLRTPKKCQCPLTTEPPLQTLLPLAFTLSRPLAQQQLQPEIFVRLRLSGQQQMMVQRRLAQEVAACFLRQFILKTNPSHWKARCSPASVLVNREQIGNRLKLSQEDLEFEASLGYIP